jgi:putative FmdB family regulatory protein
MPIYEYRCLQCGQVTDALQKMSDPPLRTCRHCQADALEKIMSRTTFHLKGSGWYVTDYKGGSSDAKGETKGSGSESSPAAKSDSASASPAPAPAGPAASSGGSAD